MEIHRRPRPSNSNGTSDATTSSLPSRASGRSAKTYGPPVKARSLPENPYNTSSSTLTDVILLRCIQIILLLAFIWFIYLMAAVNTPSLDTTPLISEDDTNVGLRGNPSSTLSLKLPNNLPSINPQDIISTRDKISQMRNEFYTRYGGKEIAMTMLAKGLRTFENKSAKKNDDNNTILSSVRATANRFLSAIVRHEASVISQQQNQQAEFVMAFAGYSVTVGRGNHLEQSYPFILQNILAPILQMPPFNTKLIVRNSAIGGIPSFPYGWCLSNFLGDDADLVSWDYGMNEGNGALGLESYVRQSLLLPKSPPLFVLLDMKSKKRLDILQQYVNLGVLPDPIALGNKDAVDKKLLSLPENERPIGLQKWDEWGAPKGAPGQSPWHPKKMEHELMGWMLSMYMLDALDDALNVMESDTDWRKAVFVKEEQHTAKEVVLPPPITDASKTGAASILHGSASQTNNKEWHMNHISCRTSFLPNISGELNSIIVSGVAKDDEDMLQSRDDSLFNGGWVMDLGKLERDTKLKVLKYGGLGYIDMKTALYGIPSSGTLKLRLPYEGLKSISHPAIAINAHASEYFNAVVLCEVNEKRGDDECKMISDLDFRIGDASVPKTTVSQVKDVASYLKKDICIRVEIPTDAKLDAELGLAVEVTVSGSGVSRENGACSISHVIWENQ